MKLLLILVCLSVSLTFFFFKKSKVLLCIPDYSGAQCIDKVVFNLLENPPNYACQVLRLQTRAAILSNSFFWFLNNIRNLWKFKSVYLLLKVHYFSLVLCKMPRGLYNINNYILFIYTWMNTQIFSFHLCCLSFFPHYWVLLAIIWILHGIYPQSVSPTHRCPPSIEFQSYGNLAPQRIKGI